jgi:AcrR family transcriptional regulator
VPKVSDDHRQQVRDRLLRAARTVVLRDGHEGTTTRAILSEAGMSAGTLYNYFASKEELFEELAERAIAESVTLFNAAGAPDEDETGLLLRWVADLLGQPDTVPALTFFRGRMTPDPDVQRAIQRFNAYLVENFAGLVRTAQSQGALSTALDPDALTELFDMVVDAMNRRHVTGTFVTSFDRVGETFLALLTQAALTEPRSVPR